MAQEKDRELTPKQEQAIVALLNEQTIQKAAESVDVGFRTLQRWLSEPAFAAAYREARRQVFSQAIALTQRYAPWAVNALARILMDKDARNSSVVAAAVAILKFGREGIDLEDLAVRVESLEQAAKEKGLEQGRPMASRA